MNRIRRLLADPNRGKLLVPFFTAGYPNLKSSLDLVIAAADSGADIVEIGMPFSDPMADGPTIQYSSHLALQNGVTLKAILAGVQSLRRRTDVPIALMGYYNPVQAYGEKAFLDDAAAAGVDGLIIPDLPVDEATAFRQRVKADSLSAIFLVSPTSSPERIKLIDKSSTDLVYAVTVTGVTGTGKVFGAATDKYLKHLKQVLIKPFVAGFGVSSPQSAARLCRYADGVVIGSALVNLIRENPERKAALQAAGRFLTSVRKAMA